ncbi:Nuclear transport factor 2 (NTF2) family protein with RNA binding (RRM-RBD-RNP motif) domain [Abeliophyllum distichum]|uniref:Nuclear transport factor 2 (NTF2) family protein with RNA binding (RRM-RBD-RNP motif) domain n=1 Tax=Abeliophyllum distichum TaxID=126358 RepID=A0ABD1VTX7_9LAMI
MDQSGVQFESWVQMIISGREGNKPSLVSLSLALRSNSFQGDNLSAMATAAPQPVSAQVVGNAFVQQYYHILHLSPELVHRFYQDISQLGRPEDDGSMSITTTMQAINEKILSLNYGDFRAEIRSVDAQESFNGGVQVLVTGHLTGMDNTVCNFTQTFFLAPQDRGYFVLNDMFRFLDNVNANPVLVNDVVAPITPEQSPVLLVQENHVSEENSPSAEETNGGEVYNPPDNGELLTVEEEVPVAEVVDEVQDHLQMVVESNVKIEEVPKKSYASIVMDLKESAETFSPPPPAPRKAPSKNIEQVNPPLAPMTDGPISSSDSIDIGNNQEGEADGHSIYIKGLPMNATDALLEEVFKKFGPIKSDGIQVRSNRLQAFCFGFVEFEDASAAQKAIEASPVLVGGRQAVVEEKRSTNSRGSNRGRFQPGRGSGFRNDGVRGRGNYGGGRGYNRVDFSGRNEFGNRGGNRGGSSNRGTDGYHRSDSVNSNGGRMSRTGGMANGTNKNMTPRVSATA